MSVLPPAGDHGDDALRVAVALGLDPATVLDLAQSLNPVAPPIAPIVARHLGVLGRYPDAAPARAALAAAMGVEEEHLLLTNGGAEAIALVAGELRAGRVDEPEFALYCRHLEVVDPAAGRWRSNPHNPSGRLAAPDERAAVWDEAFYPLAAGAWTRGDHLGGSIIVGSLTKLFACPGLRIGYVLASDGELLARLAARQPRWSLNGLAAAALPDLLDVADLPVWCDRIGELRRQLTALLSAHGLLVEAADAPWVLVHSAGDLRARLAPAGVVVRDCASFGMAGVARLAVPDEAGLERLDDALARSAPGPPS